MGNWNIPRYLFGHVYRRTDVHHVTDQTPAGRAVMTDLPGLNRGAVGHLASFRGGSIFSRSAIPSSPGPNPPAVPSSSSIFRSSVCGWVGRLRQSSRCWPRSSHARRGEASSSMTGLSSVRWSESSRSRPGTSS